MTAPVPADFDADLAALQNALAGEYSIERELGRGGMATVYLAREVRLDRLVARFGAWTLGVFAAAALASLLPRADSRANPRRRDLSPLGEGGSLRSSETGGDRRLGAAARTADA